MPNPRHLEDKYELDLTFFRLFAGLAALAITSDIFSVEGKSKPAFAYRILPLLLKACSINVVNDKYFNGKSEHFSRYIMN